MALLPAISQLSTKTKEGDFFLLLSPFSRFHLMEFAKIPFHIKKIAHLFM